MVFDLVETCVVPLLATVDSLDLPSRLVQACIDKAGAYGVGCAMVGYFRASVQVSSPIGWHHVVVSRTSCELSTRSWVEEFAMLPFDELG